MKVSDSYQQGFFVSMCNAVEEMSHEIRSFYISLSLFLVFRPSFVSAKLIAIREEVKIDFVELEYRAE
jgi:hypothetical protein